jgi:hypothetical protein
MKKEFPFDVRFCARCEQHHDQLVFKQLLRPAENFSAWATCPVTGEPIVLWIEDDGENT